MYHGLLFLLEFIFARVLVSCFTYIISEKKIFTSMKFKSYEGLLDRGNILEHTARNTKAPKIFKTPII